MGERLNRTKCKRCGKWHNPNRGYTKALCACIDALNNAAWDKELDPTRDPAFPMPTYDERLAEGFRLIGMAGA